MENEIINWLVVILGGGSIGTILATILVLVVKGAMSKTTKKILEKSNNENLIKKVTNEVFTQLKNVVIDFKAQPLAENELKLIEESARKLAENYFKKSIQTSIDVIIVLENLSNIFLKNGYAIADEDKQNLIDSIEKAKNDAGIKEGKVEIIIPEQKEEEVVESETKKVSCETKTNNGAFL